jgi:hypothetical protein
VPEYESDIDEDTVIGRSDPEEKVDNNGCTSPTASAPMMIST